MGAPNREFVEILAADAELLDVNSSAGNKSDKSALHEQKSTLKRRLQMFQGEELALFYCT
jgi:hypothetical protein